ncbi:MAG TPA: reverse transcriptase-like protein [Gaiellales bacterium]|nr:reverse transcriptase-like protein [Gaiellales bacterium]
MGSRPQQRKTARRRSGGTLKDGERRRLAAASRALRGEQPQRPVAWCDGGVRGNRAAVAFVLTAAGGRVLAEEVRLVGPAAVEDVECAAIAAALERAAELRLDGLEVRLDSQVVVDWLNAVHRPAAGRRALRPVLAQLPKLDRVSFRWISRDENARVDRLVWSALDADRSPTDNGR